MGTGVSVAHMIDLVLPGALDSRCTITDLYGTGVSVAHQIDLVLHQIDLVRSGGDCDESWMCLWRIWWGSGVIWC